MDDKLETASHVSQEIATEIDSAARLLPAVPLSWATVAREPPFLQK